MADITALDSETLDELRYVWLSRLMFGNLGVVDPRIYAENRTFEEFVAAQRVAELEQEANRG